MCHLKYQTGKKVESKRIQLLDGEVIRSLKGENWKYFGILQAKQMKPTEMKGKVKREYFRHVLEPKLYGENIIKGINT